MNLFKILYALRACGTFVLLLTLLILYVILISLRQESDVPKHLQKYLMFNGLPNNEDIEIEKIKYKIKENNAKLEIHNSRNFGSVRSQTTILLVQVHKDIERLQYLIVSLAQVRYIDSVLIIFSHSYYSDDMNMLIKKINFCKVMQIFYPHSLQVHPDKFPGIDPEDCVSDGQDKNSSFCQDRDARLTQHKQHWWWKANFVFNNMPWSQSYKGTVIFLEENHYVAPDLLHILQYAERCLSYFPQVEVMSFGRTYVKNMDAHLLTFETWRPPFDVGLAFNKTTWKKILSLSSFYCMYNDCSWSYSLLNLFTNFSNGNVNMVACVAARVISTKQFLTLDNALAELTRAFRYDTRMYPEKVEAVFIVGPDGRFERKAKSPPKGNGGWKDIRDQLLCLDPLMTTTEDYYTTTSSFTENIL